MKKGKLGNWALMTHRDLERLDEGRFLLLSFPCHGIYLWEGWTEKEENRRCVNYHFFLAVWDRKLQGFSNQAKNRWKSKALFFLILQLQFKEGPSGVQLLNKYTIKKTDWQGRKLLSKIWFLIGNWLFLISALMADRTCTSVLFV